MVQSKIYSLSSCLKRECACDAEGNGFQSQLQKVLNRYKRKEYRPMVWILYSDYTEIELYCYEK
jgi:hypothetical protein